MTTPPAAEITPRVERNEGESRYEIWYDDLLGGFAEFEPDSQGRLVFSHTEVDPAYSGKGLGSILVAGALEDAARRGETVVPRCPFVERYLHRHSVEGLTVDWPNESGFVR